MVGYAFWAVFCSSQRSKIGPTAQKDSAAILSPIFSLLEYVHLSKSKILGLILRGFGVFWTILLLIIISAIICPSKYIQPVIFLDSLYIPHSQYTHIVHFDHQSTLGTIHLRRRQIFTIFDPYPLPSAFQQNAYEGDFWYLCTVTFQPSAHGDTPPPLRHADVLNEWSLNSRS